MNERIRELMNDAVRFHWDHDGQAYEAQVHPEDLEYFAELIIRECAEACMKEIDIGSMMSPKSPWMAKQILEHFGLE